MVFVVSDTNKATYCFSPPALQAGGRGFESRHVHQLYFFQRNSVDVFSAYHLLLKQGLRISNRLTSTNLLLALTIKCATFSTALFWCNSGQSVQVSFVREEGSMNLSRRSRAPRSNPPAYEM